MAGQRQPIELLQARGKKHLTKAEIDQRMTSEVKPCVDGIRAPDYLTKAQRSRFDELAEQLQKIKIMGETDVDALARYIVAHDLYVAAARDVRIMQKKKPEQKTVLAMADWAELMDKLDKRQDRYFKQAQSCARDLGLTISSRCKLVVPEKEEAPKENKFAKFKGGAVG